MNTVEILKILEKSNCRECKAPTCLAFAAAVYNGERELSECPKLSSEILKEYGGNREKRITTEQSEEEAQKITQAKIASTDLSEAAKRLGEDFADDRLTIKICGKDFSVDKQGNFYSDIHIHSWLTGPVISYILTGKGLKPKGEWMPLRELNKGKDWYRLFGQRCEKPLKKMADTYTDFFEDILSIFNGRKVENHYGSDISIVLHPLPKVPMLICYWWPEDGMESDLNLFFDSTANDNIEIEALYSLGAGLCNMFEKISMTHEQG